MNDKKDKILQHFLTSVDDLYKDIENWLTTTQLKTIYEDFEIKEEAYGVYKIKKLIIKDTEEAIIANITPIGARIIGANGRVDLLGSLDKAIIINLDKGGPIITTTISFEDSKQTQTSKKKIYQGIEDAGWYWFEDRRRGKAHKLNKEIFYELLTEVSDYEFR